MVKFSQIVLLLCGVLLYAKTSFGQATDPSLYTAIDTYVAAFEAEESNALAEVMKKLTPGCLQPGIAGHLKTIGKLPPIQDISEVYNFECIADKIIKLSEPLKANQFLGKLAKIDGNTPICSADENCSGAESCLPLDQDNLLEYNGVKGGLLDAVKEKVDSDTSNAGFLIGETATSNSCQFNHQCQSYFCKIPYGSTNGVCENIKVCRLGSNEEKVKAEGRCETSLVKNSANVCQGPLQDDKDLLRIYKKIKTDINGQACGAFTEEVSNYISKFATDLRAFELMVQYSQNLQADYTSVKGANRLSYHQVPKRLKEMFVTEYVTEKQSDIKNMNEEFVKFNNSFAEILKTNGTNIDEINFLDQKEIIKKMHEQKIDATYYLQLYQFWIKTQQQFYTKTFTTLKNNVLQEDLSGKKGFLALLDSLAKTKRNTKTAPLFNNDKGRPNSKRWFISLSLPNNTSTFNEFYDERFVLPEELKASNFVDKIEGTFGSSSYQTFNWTNPANKSEKALEYITPQPGNIKNKFLLDPIFPPGGCKIIQDSGNGNECGQKSFWNIFAGSKGTFESNITNTLEKLYNAWYEVVLTHYKKLALGAAANTIIDPELSLYAGCINEMTGAQKGAAVSEKSLFYKNFCTPDKNKNGAVDANERLTELTLKMLTKKIMTFSLAYSFNPIKGSASFLTQNKQYAYEFRVDESAQKKKKSDWIDLDLPQIDPNTKFYDFQFGNKKKFLNHMRNKYFFMGNIYQLLGKTFDRQLACLNPTEYDHDTVIEPNLLTPTPTPSPTPKPGFTNTTKEDLTTKSTTVTATNKKNTTSTSSSTSSTTSGGSSGSSNPSFSSSSGSAGSSSPIADNITGNELNDKKTIIVDGVVSKTESLTTDKKNGFADYGAFGGAESGQAGGIVTLTESEKDKIDAAMNSSQNPHFSEDSLFTQITHRYVKSYKKIFRTERLGSAQ